MIDGFQERPTFLTPLRVIGLFLLALLLSVMLNCGSGHMLPMMPMHSSPVECGSMFFGELSISIRELGSPLITLGLLGAIFITYFRKGFDWLRFFQSRFKLLFRVNVEDIPDLLTQLFSCGILHPKIY